MDKIKSKLSGLGGLIALFGIISIVLHFLGYNLKILFWIDMWGSGTGWAIRIGLVVVGAALFLVGSMGGSGDEERSSAEEES